MSFDSMGGIDQACITRTETREFSEQLPNGQKKLTDRLKLYFDPDKQTLRWEPQNDSEFSEPVFTEDFDENEIEVDLSGKGNGKPILGLTNEGTFQILLTKKSEEPFQVPENIKKIVNLNSGEWDVKPDNQGITLKSVEK